MAVVGGWRGSGARNQFNEHRAGTREDDAVLQTGGGGSCITLCMCLMSLNYMLKMVTMVTFMLCVFYYKKKMKKRKGRK